MLTKKRHAGAQSGPPKKRLHVDKVKSNGSTEAGTLKKAVRKLPVTSSAANGDDSDEDGSDGGEGGESEENDEDLDESTPGKTGSQNITGKSSRESHKIQKAVHQERRANKQHSVLLNDAKRLWSKARQKNVPKEERQKYIKELMDIVRGKVQDVALKHDASRIIQTIVKYGGQKERDEVAAELKGKFKDLAQNKYSKFLVTKLIRSSPTHRTSILREFKGHVVRLLLHSDSSSVIADAYELYANAYEKAFLLYDFYGTEVALFTPALNKTSVDDEEKDKLKKGLQGALGGADTEKKKRILAAVKEKLDLVINNPDKGAISHAIFHHVLWEYMTQVNELDDKGESDKLRRDIFEGCQEVLAEMVHTKDGSRVVREFIAYGTAKDRKQVVKVLKPHVERICKDDEAQLVLFTALDVIDDTKLTGKALVSEVVQAAPTLYTSHQGRRALFHLLVPRSTRYFTPAQIALLSQTDPIKKITSKKDDAMRREEILRAASKDLIDFITPIEMLEKLLRDPGGSLLITEILLHAEGDKSDAVDSLIGLIQKPYPSPDQHKPHIIDVPHSCRVYKTLLQGGHFSQQTKAVARSTAFSPYNFAGMWLKKADKQNTRAIGLGGGAFVVAALYERIRDEGSEDEKAELGSWFDSTFIDDLQNKETKGKAVLLDTLRC